jgi:hypothetical protein
MPVYGTGRTITNLTGYNFQSIPQKDGLFDLIAIGVKTKKAAAAALIYYKNTGTPGSPEFGNPTIMQLDGKPFREAFTQSISARFVGDLNADKIPDVVLAAYPEDDPNGYWPGGISMWSGEDNPNAGPGCGYDIEGNWLGREKIGKSGKLQFKDLRKVFYRIPGFAVQWKSYFAWSAFGAIDLDNQKYLLYAGNVDKIYAAQLSVVGDDLFCGQRVNLLKDNKAIYANFYFSQIITQDMDNDGSKEILLDGNQGRVVVLKGSKIGQFAEVGCLQMLGGDLCVNELATPTRIDWRI